MLEFIQISNIWIWEIIKFIFGSFIIISMLVPICGAILSLISYLLLGNNKSWK